MANRKTTTSTEVKQRWENSAYQKYMIRLRVEDDADLIAFIDENKEAIGTTELFRRALSKLMEDGI